jgi:hypothetical protein
MVPPLNSPGKNKKKTVPLLTINKNRIAQECNHTQSDSNDLVFDKNDENKHTFNILKFNKRNLFTSTASLLEHI